MITYKVSGSFKKTRSFIKRLNPDRIIPILAKYGARGCDALYEATPKATGLTANSWGYELEIRRNEYAIYWTNSNINDGVSIAVILRYGHGTRNGGYVEGTDYISPAVTPMFEQIAYEAWKEVIG